MTARQRIIPVRREYNRWVANQTLEDYALRFTAKSARHFSSERISQTAIGAISFLALEAIGGAITLSYGTTNAFYAIIVASIAMLAIGLPISRYAVRHGVDIDLLTRGAGFGYIGSTITSLIYASFTFMLFAIEASIMSGALELTLGIPLWIGYIISAVMVIPLVTHGVRLISKFQLMTQPFWIVLNILPFIFIAFMDWEKFDLWRAFAGIRHASGPPGTVAEFDLVEFGAASAVILALMSQIGEQADFLRFLPPVPQRKWHHRLAVFLAGPGWVIIGAPKLLAGSFLVVLTFTSGVPLDRAADPAQMYLTPRLHGSLARCRAAVDGRLRRRLAAQDQRNERLCRLARLVELLLPADPQPSRPRHLAGLQRCDRSALDGTRHLSAAGGDARHLLDHRHGLALHDLCRSLHQQAAGARPSRHRVQARPSLRHQPGRLGAMTLSATISLIAHFGAFGEIAASLAPYITLVIALIATPALAWATRGKFYLARKPRQSWKNLTSITCSVCEHPFEPEDMAWCPAYAAPICSLCCSLDSRCHDMCKPAARFNAQVGTVAKTLLPESILGKLTTRLGRYGIAVALALTAIGAILAMIAHQVASASPETAEVVNRTILIVFFVFSVISGVVCWFYVLAHDSRVVAEEESSRQNTLLLKEIAAHKKTDAALQNAKETAEAANRAKSRYVVGLSHELRTPLNAVLGYAQILERDETIPAPRQPSIKVIRRSAEHLSGLIDGLLDISKIEAGRLQVYSNEINIQDFLDQIVEMFRPQAQAKGLAFIHDRSPALPQFVRTDEKRLRQILVNLLSNAIKFTDEGSVTFDVGYRSQVATFTVTDTGRGIAEKDLTRIYEPFQRGEADSVRPMPGLGLGLTITRLLTNTLGGEIAVSSVKDEGSTFRVRLMLSAVMRAAAPPQEKRIVGYDGPRRTIVVVDDNEDHRDMMREILAPLDFIVLTAAGGAECLTLIDGIMPDLFLVDILMPGMSGWQLVSRLREAGQTAPVLMLSANIGDATVLSESDDSHNDAIGKPVDIRQLRDKLALHLGLNWVYADDAPIPPAKTEAPMLSPGAAHVQELLRLGEIGYIRGIEAKLSDLAKLEANRPFTEALRPYVAAFDLAGFMTFLHDFEEKVEPIG